MLGNGQLEKPVSLTFDLKGNILVLDNERIQVKWIFQSLESFGFKILKLVAGLFWRWRMDKRSAGIYFVNLSLSLTRSLISFFSQFKSSQMRDSLNGLTMADSSLLLYDTYSVVR